MKNNTYLNKICTGCRCTFFNVKNIKPSQFMRIKYCNKDCRIANSNFARNVKNYSGTIINNIKILNQNGKTAAGTIKYDCQCYCGKIFNTRVARLINKTTTSCGCYQKKLISKMSSSRCKDKHWNWNPNLTDEDRIKKRDIQQINELRKKVFLRDKYKCQLCNNDRKLNHHHLDGWNWCKEKRLDINNCITLCEKCHNKFHKKYGRGNNTREQFENFKYEEKL